MYTSSIQFERVYKAANLSWFRVQQDRKVYESYCPEAVKLGLGKVSSTYFPTRGFIFGPLTGLVEKLQENISHAQQAGRAVVNFPRFADLNTARSNLDLYQQSDDSVIGSASNYCRREQPINRFVSECNSAHRVNLLHLSPCQFAPLGGYAFSCGSNVCRVGKYLGVGFMGYTARSPTRNSVPGINPFVSVKSGCDKNYTMAQCGNFAFLISLGRRCGIGELTSAICRDNDFSRGGVDDRNSSVVDLGRCVLLREHIREESAHVFVQPTSASFTFECNGATVLQGWKVHIE